MHSALLCDETVEDYIASGKSINIDDLCPDRRQSYETGDHELLAICYVCVDLNDDRAVLPTPASAPTAISQTQESATAVSSATAPDDNPIINCSYDAFVVTTNSTNPVQRVKKGAPFNPDNATRLHGVRINEQVVLTAFLKKDNLMAWAIKNRNRRARKMNKPNFVRPL
jgi:hypothetical protein